MTDYASELLRGTAPAPKQAPPAPTDYASELFGASKPAATGRQQIANADTNEGTASFATLSKASMVDDPATKIRIFARARFPKLPEPEAVARYQMVDGEPVYTGDDGKMYRETPGGVGGFFKNVGAGIVGNPGATIGGAAGAIAGAPAGPLGAAAGAALGAAGGKGFDKTAANLAFDEPQTVGGNVKAMAVEGGVNAAFSGAGSAVGKFLERGLARDIGKVSQPAVQQITQKANAAGIDLNPAQITNLPSLKGKHDALATLPTSKDIIQEGAQRQAGQASAAIDRFVQSVSKNSGLDEAGEGARTAAKSIIEGIVRDRSSKAAPLYQAAFANAQGIPRELTEEVVGLMQRPAMDAAAKKAITLAANEGIELSNPTNTLQGMHYMKLALDDMIEGRMAAEGGIGNVEKRQFVNLKNQLLTVMDRMSPDYKKAREVFAHFSPAVNNIREGMVSKLGDLADESTFKASGMVFGGNISPKTVQRTGELFRNAGMGDQWNALIRARLEDMWSQAGKQRQTTGGAITQAPRFQAMVWGDPKQKALLEAAMEPGQRAAMTDLMDVFQAMARTAHAGAGSQTAGRLEAANLMRQESGSGAGTVAKLFSPQQWGVAAGKWLDEVRLGQHAQKMAEIMTSPDGMKRLRDLKRLGPGDKAFIQGAASLFGLSVAPDGVGTDTSQGATR